MAGVGDDDAALRVDGDVVRVAEVGLGGRAVVAAVGAGAVPRHGADDAGGRLDDADALVPGVGEVDAPVRGDVDTGYAVDVALGGRLAVVHVGAAENGGDDSGGRRRSGACVRSSLPRKRCRPGSAQIPASTELQWVSVPGSPSSPKPGQPLPTRVVTMPVAASTLRMRKPYFSPT